MSGLSGYGIAENAYYDRQFAAAAEKRRLKKERAAEGGSLGKYQSFMAGHNTQPVRFQNYSGISQPSTRRPARIMNRANYTTRYVPDSGGHGEMMGDQNWSLDQWEDFAKVPVSDSRKTVTNRGPGYSSTKSYGATKPWRGGYLNDADFNQATWLESQETSDKAQKAYDEAKAINESRYNEILGGYRARQDDAMNMVANLGTAEKDAIRRSYGKERSRMMQGLLDSGNLSTTVMPSVSLQNNEAKNRSLADVNERLTKQKIGLQTGLSGDKLSFMERREDAYPDQSYYLDLLKQAGYAAA